MYIEANPIKKQEIYDKHLYEIAGIKFTPRQIDVLSCLIHKRNYSKIADLLLIDSTRTIQTHIRDIRAKLGNIAVEHVIDFVEKSGKRQYLAEYYFQILIRSCFETKLKKIRSVINRNCTSYYLRKPPIISAIKNSLLNQLIRHLEIANIKSINRQNPLETKKDSKFMLYIIGNDFSTNENQLNQSINTDESKNIYLLFGESTDHTPVASQDYVDFREPANYYSSTCGLIKKILDNPSVEEIINEFKEEFQAIQKSWEGSRSKGDTVINSFLPKLGIQRLFIYIAILSIAYIVAYPYIKNVIFNNKEKQFARSDLIIPIKTAFLERPAIIKKMNDRLQGTKDGIKTIALTGIIGVGGAGKTTSARYYAKSALGSSVVWELDAETKDTLTNSLRDLAYALADNAELKQGFDFIQWIQDIELKEKLLLNFIKAQLKANPNWILIYDNMESFAQISHLFPLDSKQWGNGKVIITTRNEHMIETSFINPEDIIHIDELSNEEMLILFSKILYDCEPSKLKPTDYNMTVNFLKNIPPFPLDVSVAAYSIKNTHVTFEQYLRHVGDHSANYDTMQVKLLKEVSSYDKTRYGIISSTIEKLNKINPNFKELFFFICFLDSQNIPYRLLESYKNTLMVDDFVYNLRRNGLLIRSSYSNFSKENKFISIYRDTQEIGAMFLINSLPETEKEFFIKNITSAISNFYQDCIKKKDTKNIILLTTHLEASLNMTQNISISQGIKNKYEADLYLILGYAYYKSTKNLVQTRDCFKKILEKTEGGYYLPSKVLATLLKDLSDVCLTMNHLEEALEYCKRSIALCKEFSGSELIIADNLQILGAYYRKNNNFDEANKSFKEALNVLSKIDHEVSKELKAEIYIQLSHLYTLYYLNKKEGKDADKYAKKALKVLSGSEFFYIKEKPPPSGASCLIARHRWKYSMVFIRHYANYDDAYHNLREAEYLMNNRCPEDMHLKGRIFSLLGEVALCRQNNPLEAEARLTEAINILDLALGLNSTWTYYLKRAEAKIRLNKFSDGYKDCLHIFRLGHIERSNFHDLSYYTTFYHAAFAKYNLGDYQKSLEYFAAFFEKIDNFCQKFLDNKIYKKLVAGNVFIITPYNVETVHKDIKSYLQRSLVIFANIYGINHPFVQEYIAKNIDK